ncbi:hypothetical protein D8780_01670 [Notoacmeibacter ruber]|uniref:Uncharacterized protein n=1 Tax=Notoacmeibacter ruber TaxID=2670375 RepID=A0A3L7JF63_9HYPH|nr:hypothetical protein D8780_01670 [Notoacmeibacter ruber]
MIPIKRKRYIAARQRIFFGHSVDKEKSVPPKIEYFPEKIKYSLSVKKCIRSFKLEQATAAEDRF